MPSLFGRSLRKEELRKLVGDVSQVAGIRMVELADGRVRGMRAADVYTGSGLRFQVLADRGLDLGAAEHAGRPLAFVHPALGTPALRERQGLGWLRTFGGGLVTTCGLDHFGPPDPEGVCGLEPSTHAMAPTRREQRESGAMRELGPGESVSFRLEIGALADAAAVGLFEQALGGPRPL